MDSIIYYFKRKDLYDCLVSLSEFASIDTHHFTKKYKILNICYRAIQAYFLIGAIGEFILMVQSFLNYKNGTKLEFLCSDELNSTPFKEFFLILHVYSSFINIPFLVGFSGLLYFLIVFFYCYVKFLKEKIMEIDMYDKEENIFMKYKECAEKFSKIIM